MINSPNEIDTGTEEGKMLVAALSIITTSIEYQDKTPDQALEDVNFIRDSIYGEKSKPKMSNVDFFVLVFLYTVIVVLISLAVIYGDQVKADFETFKNLIR